MVDHQVSEDSDGVWMCGPECPFDDMRDCPKWEACHKWHVSSDPNCLPIESVPDSAAFETLFYSFAFERFVCRLGIKPGTPGDQFIVEGDGPTPRAAMLAAIERVGK